MSLQIRRRDLVAFGSLALASPWVAAVAHAQEALFGAAVPRATLGYIEETAFLGSLRKLPRAVRNPAAARLAEGAGTVVPAHHLPLGDTDLVGRPLRLTVHGLYPGAALRGDARRALPLAVDLDVLFPAPEPAISDAPIRFHAWSFRRRPGWNPSPPVSFVFPLDWYVYPVLEVRVVPRGGGAAVVMRTRFTLDDENGLPRLRRGVYLLGLAPEAWRTGMDLAELARTGPASRLSLLVSIDAEPLGG
ncbi:MAG TPA: hypothetical protein VF121_06225 [Thermoanaerobaculia bacterium]|nr:hypothetical protein [Thermoanaerobaculia bacterium]